MQNLAIDHYLEKDFFVPLANMYYDEALKNLTPKEFKTYMAIICIGKGIGPNLKLLFTSKTILLKTINTIYRITEKTFYKHLLKIEELGLLEFEKGACNLGFDISDAKAGGFTSIDIAELTYLLKLPNLEFKLFFAVLRITKGFQREAIKATYGLLKHYSNIASNTSLKAAIDSLKSSNLISSLQDVLSGRITYKLKKVAIPAPLDLVKEEQKNAEIETSCVATVKNELHQVKNGQHCHDATVENGHIKRNSSFSNKYLKESCAENSEQKKSFTKKAEQFKQENEKKIFKFIKENSKTNHLDQSQIKHIAQQLLQEVKSFGGYKGIKIKSTADFYLAQEHQIYGRNIDKIIDRLLERNKQIERDHQARQIFLNAISNYYPEEAMGLDDFRKDSICCSKIDKLIKKSPGLGYWADNYIIEWEETENPEYSQEVECENKKYMQSLFKKRVGDREISFEERIELLEEFLPLVNEMFPQIDSYILISKKLTFKQFINKYAG